MLEKLNEVFEKIKEIIIRNLKQAAYKIWDEIQIELSCRKWEKSTGKKYTKEGKKNQKKIYRFVKRLGREVKGGVCHSINIKR